jgi:PKD repeat protein
MKQFLLLATFITLSFSAFSATITIGTGGTTNTSTTYPAPYGNWYWGAKHQLMVTAAELNAAGMTAGNINSLAFDVQSINGVVLEDYEIGLKHTGATSATAFEAGFTNVYGPTNYAPTAGLNTHSFSSPFYWDGIQNILIDVCFNNTGFTGNDVTYYTSTSYTSVVYRFQDAANVCSTPAFIQTSTDRPNIQFDWTVPSIPPVADFVASTLVTCSGDICFTDLSSNTPTSWLWDFGDGGTDNLENPCYTYTTSGNYTVTLTSTNAFGNDVEVKTAYITVNLSGGTPVTIACTPATLNGTLGFGISNVQINTLNNSTGTSAEGYGDFTCQQTTLFAGQTYSFSATFVGPSTLNAAVWIDYNNDGVLNDVTERVLDVSGSMALSGNITIPASAVLTAPLRMRVSADYDFSAPPTPCSDSDFGQAEDYTVIIEQDTSPPVTTFTSDVVKTCDGVVNFQDLSTNIPIAWLWDFGDGNTSIAQNPTHTYLITGSYDVSLTSSNVFGNNSTTVIGYVDVTLGNQLVTATCTPATLGYCCDYGIYRVEINGILNSSPDGVEGYRDYSCEYTTSVDEGSSQTLDVRTGPSAHDTKVWIDYNNDGAFDDLTELIMDAPSTTNPSISYVAPVGVAVLNVALRMRVMSDVIGGITDACSNQTFGQTEDYSIKFLDPISVKENEFSYSINMFPNPASSELNINVVTGEPIDNWILVDLTGRILKSSEVSNNSHKIYVSDLSAGQYIVIMRVNEVQVSMPFFKL